MSSLNVFQVVMDMNGPPGLIHPLLVENYAWVDERLREMYNIYALTASNCDEYKSAGLLKENWSWVDNRLDEMCNSVESSYISYKRKRSETDISVYEVEIGRSIKRLRCQSPIFTSKYLLNPLSNQFYNLDCERYNYAGASHQVNEVSEDETVSSLGSESEYNSYSQPMVVDINQDMSSFMDYYWDDDYKKAQYNIISSNVNVVSDYEDYEDREDYEDYEDYEASQNMSYNGFLSSL